MRLQEQERGLLSRFPLRLCRKAGSGCCPHVPLDHFGLAYCGVSVLESWRRLNISQHSPCSPCIRRQTSQLQAPSSNFSSSIDVVWTFFSRRVSDTYRHTHPRSKRHSPVRPAADHDGQEEARPPGRRGDLGPALVLLLCVRRRPALPRAILADPAAGERDFEDLKLLISHQKAKHFKCDRCGKRLNTAGGTPATRRCVPLPPEKTTIADNCPLLSQVSPCT